MLGLAIYSMFVAVTYSLRTQLCLIGKTISIALLIYPGLGLALSGWKHVSELKRKNSFVDHTDSFGRFGHFKEVQTAILQQSTHDKSWIYRLKDG